MLNFFCNEQQTSEMRKISCINNSQGVSFGRSMSYPT